MNNLKIQKKRYKKSVLITIISFILLVIWTIIGCNSNSTSTSPDTVEQTENTDDSAEITSNPTDSENSDNSAMQTDWSVSTYISLADIPAYTDSPYVEINENVPFFTEVQQATGPIEEYFDLDELGRCRGAIALLDRNMMPTEERGPIGHVRPSGWHTVKYPEVISDLYLYNRCHLIAYELTGQNDNVNNLITGTRYMNVEGMLPFENKVAAFLRKNEGIHVLYRVTPLFDGENLVASGVLMEARSIEYGGEGLSFCIYCYNVQPHISIDYTDGSSYQEPGSTPDSTAEDSNNDEQGDVMVYITATGEKYHREDCENLSHSKIPIVLSEAKASGKTPCSNCNPPE